jgi:uncharacterized protein (TIGR04255 family)
MGNAHLGAFWKSLEGDWNTVEDAPSLEPQLESFKEVPEWGAIKFRLTRDISSRLQIRNTEKDRMIQVQNGRLHVNWLGHDGGEYPRYAKVRGLFDSAFNWFSKYVRDAGLGEIRPNQWEVTYVNRIQKGTVWNSPDDWSFYRPLRTLDGLESIKLESVSGEWHFQILDRRGRLHAQFQHVRNPDDSTADAIVLNLTARGSVGSTENELSLDHGLDLGHEIIVTNFRHLMSDQANLYWGLQNGNC